MERAKHIPVESVRRETAALRRLARVLVRDTTDAEDVVQDTWLSSLRRPPRDDRPIRPWLARVLRNAAISRARSAARARARESAAAPPSTTDPDALDRLLISRQLLEEVERLPAEDRRLLVLVFWEGRPSVECARVLGRPPSTIRSQLHRALAKLRARLDARRGGREAWLAALAPMAGPPRATPVAAVALGGVLSVAGIAAAAVLPPGCSTELAAVTTADEQASARPQARVGPPSTPWGVATSRPAPPRDASALDASTDQPPRRAPEHPKIAYFYAYKESLELLAECRHGDAPGSLRFTPSVRFDADHPPLVESVRFEAIDNVTDEEVECLRQTLLSMSIEKPIDWDSPWTYTPTAELSFDASGRMFQRGISRGPATRLATATKLGDDLAEAVAACAPARRSDAEVVLLFTFEPSSGDLLRVAAAQEHATSAIGSCAAAAGSRLVDSGRSFEPEQPEDATLSCTFALGTASPYTCRRLGVDGRYVERPKRAH